jgi:hypothetical protein
MWYLWEWHYRGQNVICSLSFLNVTFYNPNGKFWHICLNAFQFPQKGCCQEACATLNQNLQNKVTDWTNGFFFGYKFSQNYNLQIQKGIPIKKISVFLEKNLQIFKNLFLEKARHILTQCLVLRQILINFGQCFLQTCCQLVPNFLLGCL